MPLEPDLIYCADEQTPSLSPDALRVMLNQSGFRCRAEQREGEDVDLVIAADATTLGLAVEAGTVVEIAVRQTFVDPAGMKRAARVCEFLETMGWFRAE